MRGVSALVFNPASNLNPINLARNAAELGTSITVSILPARLSSTLGLQRALTRKQKQNIAEKNQVGLFSQSLLSPCVCSLWCVSPLS